MRDVSVQSEAASICSVWISDSIDVYKRQIIEVADEKTPDQASKVVENGIRTKEAERIMKYIKEDSYVVTLEIQGKMLSSEAVSYTHLDVYKRQVMRYFLR